MNQFVCNQCGQSFEQQSPYDQHLAGTHPPRAMGVTELEKALAPADFPKSKGDLIEYCSRQVTMEATILEALESIPDRVYGSAAEVATAFQEAASKDRHRQPAHQHS